jgi:hypothetical protein
MEITMKTRFAAVAGMLVLAVALLVLAAGVAQARPSLPQLIEHHSPLVAAASSGGGTVGAGTGAAAPLAAGRSAVGGRAATFERGRLAPSATTTGSVGVYSGLGVVLLALAGLATGLIVSERRRRSVAPASASDATVSPLTPAKTSPAARSEGSKDTRRKAA